MHGLCTFLFFGLGITMAVFGICALAGVSIPFIASIASGLGITLIGAAIGGLIFGLFAALFPHKLTEFVFGAIELAVAAGILTFAGLAILGALLIDCITCPFRMCLKNSKADDTSYKSNPVIDNNPKSTNYSEDGVRYQRLLSADKSSATDGIEIITPGARMAMDNSSSS